MTTHANKEVVRHFVEDVVNGAHPERAPEYAAPEFLLHFPGEVSPIERANLPEFFAKTRAAFPDYRVHVHELIAEGDNVVAITNQFGTNQGEYLGMPATGKTYEEPGYVVYRLHHGKITEARPIFDRLDIMEQLGVWQRPKVRMEAPADSGC